MAKDYLPDSYLRKRQRDAKLRLMRDLAAFGLVIVAAIVVGWFVYHKWIENKRQQDVVTEEMAQQRQELSDKQELQASASIPGTSGTEGELGSQQAIPEMSDADLSALNYTNSFPLIKVSVETGANGDKRTKESSTEEAEKTAEEEKPAEEKKSDKENSKLQEAAAAAKKPVESEEQTEKKEDKPAATEEKKSEEKPAEKPEQEKPAEQASSGTVVFNVYAGAHNTRADAEAQVKDLSGIGYKGSIIEAQPNYLVFVGTFTSYADAEALRDKLKSSGFSAFASKTKK